MFDFSSHQILILLAGVGLVGFGLIALIVSFLRPRKQPSASAPAQNEPTSSAPKGHIVVSIVPPASSAVLSSAAGGTLLVSRRNAFARGAEAPVASAELEQPPTLESAAVQFSETRADEPSESSSETKEESPSAARLEDLSILEDLYAEMFALRSSIGELSRDIESLRTRLDQSLEPTRTTSKGRTRSRSMQVQPAA